MYNNMKLIRETYGATQEEIAKVAGVNRSTVSQWESGSIIAPSTKLEKLSLFYSIGPDSFYELPELDETRIKMLKATAARAAQIEKESNMQRNKATEFQQMLENTSFPDARRRFMYSMKLLLATAESGELKDLELALQVTQKLEKRLESFIETRRAEENEKTLFEILDSLSEE